MKSEVQVGPDGKAARPRGMMHESSRGVAGLRPDISVTFAQDAVPGEILGRTVFIKAGNEGGTAFSIDYLSAFARS